MANYYSYNNCVFNDFNGFYEHTKRSAEILRNGENVFPLATDDAHLLRDCFGGFVMVKADNLEYETIYNALKNGDFYSSTKPLISVLNVWIKGLSLF